MRSLLVIRDTNIKTLVENSFNATPKVIVIQIHPDNKYLVKNAF